VLGIPIVNTSMLGAVAKATGIVSLKALEEAIRERFPGEAGNKNVDAMRKTYEAVR
jgi:Pyruvate/2-oxoacid:ferredoxin oxidoreductase gamma subunit